MRSKRPARGFCAKLPRPLTSLAETSTLFALLWLLIGLAQAATVDEVESRLAEIEDLRSMRMVSAPALSESEIKKAAGGTIITGQQSTSDGNKVYGAALLDVPIAEFYAGINDETRHGDYVNAMAYSEIQKGRACQNGREILQVIEIPVWGFSNRWWIGIKHSNDELLRESGGSVREIKWTSTIDESRVTTEHGKKMTKNAVPIGYTKGAWFMVAIGPRETWVEYYQQTDPGSGIPQSIANSQASKGVRNAMESMRKFAKEGNPSCPIQ